jgi:hypothetical protein
LLRKIEIVNTSGKEIVLVLGIDRSLPCNLHVPVSPLSVLIKPNSKSSLVLVKKELEKEYEELRVVCSVLGSPPSPGCLPM